MREEIRNKRNFSIDTNHIFTYMDAKYFANRKIYIFFKLQFFVRAKLYA